MQNRTIGWLSHAACACLIVGVIGAGCGTIEGLESGLDCPEGATSWCACPGGEEGVTTCLEGGTWDTCDCPEPIVDTPRSIEETVCEPECDGLACGADGCGGTCGDCGPGAVCAEGSCLCVPQAAKGCIGGDVHWLDSCGGAGSLVEDCAQWCEDGVCGGCTPDCEGLGCGADGCGGSCGECMGGEVCDDAGQCACPGEPTTSCVDSDLVAVDGCGVIGELVQACEYGCEDGSCLPCVPSCGETECGSDGCDGSCGSCTNGATCDAGACVCTPQESTACVAGDVRWLDSCGQVGDLLAVCEGLCASGVCVGCEPTCDAAECGSDGCGGTCGGCEGGASCDSGACVCVPDVGETCEGVDLWSHDSCGESTHLLVTCAAACGCQDLVSLATGFLGLTDLCAGETVSVPFMASGPFQADNVFTVQLSNKLGSFIGAPPIGSAPGAVSGTIEAVIPSGLAPGDGYRMRVTASTPVVAGSDNGEDLALHAPPDANFAIGAPGAWSIGFKASVGQQVPFFPAAGPESDLSWNFDAGATWSGGTLAAPLVAYQVPGLKQISLTVTDPWGCQDTRTVETEADSLEVLPCGPSIPSDAATTKPGYNEMSGGAAWVCGGHELTAGGEPGGTVFVESGGTFVFTGGGDWVIYVRAGGTFVPDEAGTSVVVYEPGAILGEADISDHVVACSDLTFDTSSAPSPGCE